MSVGYHLVDVSSLRQDGRYRDSHGEHLYEFDGPVTKDEATRILDEYEYNGHIKTPSFPYSYSVKICDENYDEYANLDESRYVKVRVTQEYLD